MARYSSGDLREFAERGAEVRLTELQNEMAAIVRQFPGISRGVRGVRRRRRGHKMSAEQKAAVGRRMKKYWAARRKANGKA